MKPKKNPIVDAEDMKSRTVYVLSGLVLVTAFILCLVEYKKIDLAGASIESSLSALEDEEVVEINPNTPPPPPPPPPPPAPPEEVEVLEEEDEREETNVIIIDQEADIDIVIEVEEEPEPVVEQIFMLLKKIRNLLVECKNFMNTWGRTFNIQKWQKKMESKEKFLSSLLFGKMERLKMLRLLKAFTKR